MRRAFCWVGIRFDLFGFELDRMMSALHWAEDSQVAPVQRMGVHPSDAVPASEFLLEHTDEVTDKRELVSVRWNVRGSYRIISHDLLLRALARP
ncbi:hypothetical protein BURPSS13_G0087 [Burkholderia pseudomallei S13]|nr:hypothetical protein BURPSS13_G0087 [Burkholderia pseudomallei S13]